MLTRERLLGVLIIIILLSAVAWEERENGALRATLAARPTVTETKEISSSQDLKRGPVKITRKTTTAPDGTKTVESTREIASEERHAADSSEIHHEEKPACPPEIRPKTRYVGLSLDPLGSFLPKELSAGVTLRGRLDVGVKYDVRRRFADGAAMLETRWRF